MANQTAIIYARQSFGVEEGSASIEVQVEACKAWAVKHNVAILATFADANTSSELYPDLPEGREAARCDRGFQAWRRAQLTKGRKEWKEGLGKAFEAIRRDRPTYILVYTSNRLGRSATASNLNNFLTSWLMECNCSIVETQTGAVTDFSDRVMLAFRAMRDALDYQSVEEKRRASMESVARRIDSYRVVAKAYATITRDGQITFDSEKAEAVRYIYGQMIAGATYSAILHGLNTQYRHLAIGKQWYHTNIMHILGNPLYAGYARNRAGEIGRATNIPEPLVTFSQWRAAQDAAQGKRAGSQKYNVAGQKRRHWLPLSGYLVCAECGRRMTMVVDKGRIYYECGSPDHTNRIEVDSQVLMAIQKICIIGVVQSRKRIASLEQASATVADLQAKVERLQGNLRAKMQLVETEEDAALYKPVLDGLKQEIKAAKAALVEAQAVGDGEAQALADRIKADMEAIWADKLLEENDYQRILSECVEKIEVSASAMTVCLRDGARVAIPRIEGKWHAKRLPACATTTYVYPSGAVRYGIRFAGEGQEARTLAEGEGYRVEIA